MLPKIRILTRIEDDELISSWSKNIANLNDQNIPLFYHVFFGHGINCSPKKDFLYNLEEIARSNSEQELFQDIPDIMCKHTAHYVTLPFLPKYRNAQRCEGVLRSMDEKRFVMPINREAFASWKICPLCVKEDIENYGRPVIHTSHNLPGVYACWRHGTELVFDDEFKNDSEIVEASEEERRVAVFMRCLYEHPIFTCREYTLNFLKSKGENTGKYKKCPPEKLAAYLASRYDFEEFSKNVERCYELYYTEELCQYDLLSDFGPVVKLRCKKCGNVFHIDPNSLVIGVGCPECMKNVKTEVLLEHYLAKHGDGNYKIAKILPQGRVSLHHTKCGQNVSKKLNGFIWENDQCYYCKKKDIEELQRYLDRIHGILEFKVLDMCYTSTGKIATIEHTNKLFGKKHQFSVHADAMKWEPYCRYCDSYVCSVDQFYVDLEKHREEYALCSGEYAYGGMQFLHRRCGTISVISSRKWSAGGRCLLCGPGRDGIYSKESDVYLQIKRGLIKKSAKTDLETSIQFLIKNDYIRITEEGYKISEQNHPHDWISLHNRG